MNFPQFSGNLFVIITLQQLHLCGPHYLALSLCDSSFTPTYTAYHYHMGPFHPRWGHFTRVPSHSPVRRGIGVVCAGSDYSIYVSLKYCKYCSAVNIYMYFWLVCGFLCVTSMGHVALRQIINNNSLI